jgi:hypothetical protein
VKGPSAKLAKLLKPFGIKPKQLWIGEQNVRGYKGRRIPRTLCRAVP